MLTGVRHVMYNDPVWAITAGYITLQNNTIGYYYRTYIMHGRNPLLG